MEQMHMTPDVRVHIITRHPQLEMRLRRLFAKATIVSCDDEVNEDELGRYQPGDLAVGIFSAPLAYELHRRYVHVISHHQEASYVQEEIYINYCLSQLFPEDKKEEDGALEKMLVAEDRFDRDATTLLRVMPEVPTRTAQIDDLLRYGFGNGVFYPERHVLASSLSEGIALEKAGFATWYHVRSSLARYQHSWEYKADDGASVARIDMNPKFLLKLVKRSPQYVEPLNYLWIKQDPPPE